ncbi:hypothetical protein B0J18DRAFT_492792 [Chaetomium sp. MPI-SDFR-AT-0129]|nr:hypothetical protein B0J18DRAFT_492792 [Chaetomium sp. MPI-SDFR-AT-0129]
MSRVMQMPPPPPLLLTKRVTAFLRANLSPHIHSAMLTSPAGSLLAHASNLPASALRRQAAVAASLFQGPSDTPATSTTNTPAPGGSVRSRRSGKHASPSVTVHLDNGAVFVIRRLRCGMLFICMGGTEGPTASGRVTPTGPAAHHNNRRNPTDAHPPQDDDQDTPLSPTTTITASTTTRSSRPSTPLALFAPSASTPSILTTPPPNLTPRSNPQPPPTSIPTPGPTSAAATTPSPTSTPQPQQSQQLPPNSPSQASILSSHTTGAASTTTSSTSATATTPTAVAASLMRRQVDELARWLDERLGGLSVPEEGIGLGGGNIELAVR